MRVFLGLVAPVLAMATAQALAAKNVEICLDAPTSYVDGLPLPTSEIKEHVMCAGDTCVTTSERCGTVQVDAVTAVRAKTISTNGLESDWVQIAGPSKPTNLRVTVTVEISDGDL